MARVVRKEVRKRGFFGWLFLVLFIGFNVVMAVSLFAGLSSVGQVEVSSEAEKAGRAIGAALGTGMILFIWVVGAVILGLFAILTRGGKTIVEEMTR